LGRKEFYGLEFLVNPSVLVPRPDTEILVETALDGIRSEELGIGEQGAGSKGRGLRVLDLCTGSGAIAIALKNQIPELEIWATDISDEALKVAKTNATRLLSPESIYFCQGDLFDAFLLPIPNSSLLIPNFFLSIPHSSFSLILSNPPYVPTAQIPGLSPDVRAEPILALDGGSDGLDFIRTIVSRAPEFLCPGGTLLLEADPCQMEVIAALLQQMGFVNIQIHKDLSGRERVIGARKVN
jgi:release factor glutamine methyltransferase